MKYSSFLASNHNEGDRPNSESKEFILREKGDEFKVV